MIKKILLFLIFLSLSQNATAVNRKSAKLGHIFVGAGLLLDFPGTFRIGRNEWELGKLNRKVFGINKLVNFKGPLYATMGLAFVNSTSNPGIFGGVGAEFFEFWIMNVRMELNGGVSIHNDQYAEINLGVTLML